MDPTTFTLLILSNASLGLLLGFIMHRSDFCLAGMFRDLFLFRQIAMLRFLFLAVAGSALLFEAGRLTGVIRLYPFPLLAPPSLGACVGGAVFGVGMVLAGGCVVGTLYRMGAGSVPSLVAFAGLIAGSAAYGEIHPFWAGFQKATTFSSALTVPLMLGIDSFWFALALLAISGYIVVRWYREGVLIRVSGAAGHLQPWKAALLLALLGAWSYAVTGMPLGVTTAYAKIGGYLESLLLTGHFRNLTFFKGSGPEFANPVTGGSLHWSVGPWMDGVSIVQFPLIAGMTAGGMLSALLVREFRLYWRLPLRQYGSAALGGVLMGVASRMAPGCNVWHLLGGLPILACQSVCFVVGLVPGAWLGSRLFLRMVGRV